MADQPERSNDAANDDPSVLTDRDEVRRWGEEHNVVPVSTGETDEERRTDLVHRDNVQSDHEEQDWDTFLEEFDERNLALAHTAAGESGRGRHRLVDRTEVVDEHGQMVDSVKKELLEGETVTTEVTEREVVETEIVEEATIESELVDSEIIDTEVVDTEIVGEELVGVAMVEMADAEVVDDAERRYLDGDEVIEIAESGTVALEIDEERIETEEQIEQKIIESRVVHQDVDEETHVEDESLDVDVDVAGVHEHLGKTGLIDARSDDVIDEQYVETEFDEDDTATSTLTEHKTVENVVNERKVLLTEVTDVEIEDSEVVSQEVVQADIVESDAGTVAERRSDPAMSSSAESAGTTSSTDSADTMSSGEAADTTSSTDSADVGSSTGTGDATPSSTDSADTTASPDEPAGRGQSSSGSTEEMRSGTESTERTEVAGTDTRSDDADVDEGRSSTARDRGGSRGAEISDNMMGRTVEMPDGEEIGIVSEVDRDEGVIYVDEDPSTTDKIKAQLHWGDDEDASVLTADQIHETRSDAVVVEGDEEPR